MREKAIAKINGEMQKNPNDQFVEVIGHYIIDRCVDDDAAAKVAAKGKSLNGALGAIRDKAQKSRHGNMAVLTHDAVYGAVDEYFGLITDGQAQLAAMSTVSLGAVGVTATVAAPPPAPAAPVGRRLALSLDDFL